MIGCGTSLVHGAGLGGAARGQRPRPHRRVRRLASCRPAAATTSSSRISRSGTTTEVAHALRARPARPARSRSPRCRTRRSPHAADDGHRARVRRRAVGRADALRHHRAHAAARPRGAGPRPRRSRDATSALDAPLPVEPGEVVRPAVGVPRPRLDRRAGQRGGAQAARVGPGMDRGLSGVRVPPRADQHRRRRAPSVWSFGPADDASRGRPRGRRAPSSRPTSTRSPRSCSPSGRGSRSPGRRARSRPPAQPRRAPSSFGGPPGVIRISFLVLALASGDRDRGHAAGAASNDCKHSNGPVEITMWHGQNDSRGQGARTSSPTSSISTHPNIKVEATSGGVRGRPDAPEGHGRAGRPAPTRTSPTSSAPTCQPGAPERSLDLTDDVKRPGLRNWDDYYAPAQARRRPSTAACARCRR